MDNADKSFLNYVDDALENLLHGSCPGAMTTGAWHDNPVANKIINKLEKLAHNLREIQELVLRLDESKPEPEASGGRSRSMQLQNLLSFMERRVSELEESSATDAMTGMLNRNAGVRAIEKRLSEVTPGEECSLVFIDLDNLKQINDTFGHKEGDLFITCVTEIISSSIRCSDIAVRYGGDEFLILFTGCDRNAAEKRMREMYGALNKHNEDAAYPYHMGYSYGIATVASGRSANIWDMVHLADRMMYANKRHRRKTVRPRPNEKSLYLEYII